MPLARTPTQPEAPLTDALDNLIAKAMVENTQWNPSFETTSTAAVKASMLSLFGSEELTEEQINARLETMRGLLTKLRTTLRIDGRPYNAAAYVMGR